MRCMREAPLPAADCRLANSCCTVWWRSDVLESNLHSRGLDCQWEALQGTPTVTGMHTNEASDRESYGCNFFARNACTKWCDLLHVSSMHGRGISNTGRLHHAWNGFVRNLLQRDGDHCCLLRHCGLCLYVGLSMGGAAMPSERSRAPPLQTP